MLSNDFVTGVISFVDLALSPVISGRILYAN
jgi:hypothetical protein